MLARMKHVLFIPVALIAIGVSVYAAELNTPKTGKPLSVNELAANPGAHSGLVSVVGVVGTVNPGKGFVLIDSKEFQDCGLSCLTEPGTKKIPFLWSGAAPQVKQTVHVDGILEKTAKGFSIKAEKVTKQ